jgi:hypothetical protein
MTSFPKLRTGAVVQYPVSRSTTYSTDIARFIDGKEQRSRSYLAALRSWAIQLELLDEGELAAFEEFFKEQAGASGVFSFTDPWDGSIYAQCSFDKDEFGTRLDGPFSGRTEFVIRENRI